MEAVRSLPIPEEGSDPLFDRIAAKAAALCGAPFAAVTIVDAFDVRLIGRSGVALSSLDRQGAFCAHAILHADLMVVEDARLDPRFAETALVAESPHVRFYAGAPILDGDALPMGTVCVLGTEPQGISAIRTFALLRLSRLASVVLKTRRFTRDLLPSDADPQTVREAQRRLDEILLPLVEDRSDLRFVDR